MRSETKRVVSAAIMWATAILVVALVDEKQYTLFLLVLLATVSLINLKKEQ